MTVLAQTLSNDTRVMSGLRTNQLYSDAQIVELLNDALDELRDKFIASLGRWFRATVTFTLPSGGLSPNSPGSNTFDLTTIPDFQMDQGLNYYPGGLNSPPVPVHRLGSFAERGRAEGTVPLGYVGGSREYFTNGDTLFVDPYTASVGTYKLIYTPQKTPLAIPTTIDVETASISVVPATTMGFTPSPGVFQLDTGPNTFLSSDVGCILSILGATNPANNGQFAIQVFNSATNVTVNDPSSVSETFPNTATVTLLRQSNVSALGVWTLFGNNPFSNSTINVKAGDTLIVKGTQHSDGSYTITQDATGGNTIVTSGAAGLTAENFNSAGISITVQPANTISELPAILMPWAMYLKLHASIAIRMGRGQPVGDLNVKMQLEEKRIPTMAALRSEGPKQAPITRRRRRYGFGFLG